MPLALTLRIVYSCEEIDSLGRFLHDLQASDDKTDGVMGKKSPGSATCGPVEVPLSTTCLQLVVVLYRPIGG